MNPTATTDIPAMRSFSRFFRKLAVIFPAFIAAIMFAACAHHGPKGEQYDIGNNGETVTVKLDKDFSVLLLCPIGDGAKWNITDIDQSIVEQMGPPMGTGNVVSGGLMRFYSYRYMFKPRATGTTTLKMELRAPEDEKPMDTFTLTINVE